MGFVAASLEYLAKHAVACLAGGVLLGLVLPDLAALLRPALAPIVIFNLTGALLRLNFGEVAQFSKRPFLLISATTFALIASPLLMWLVLSPGYLPLGLSAALILMAAAPPITTAPAFALILGLDAAFAVFIVIACHLLTPLTLPLLAASLLGIELEISLIDLMLRLALLIGGSLALTAVLKKTLFKPAVVARHGRRIEGASVFGLILFAIAIMHGVPEMMLARPGFAALTILVAFIANAGLQAAGSLVFWWSGRRIALTVGHMAGNCNMGLILAVLGSGAPPEIVLFFALAQLPMYMLPSLALPLYRRLVDAKANSNTST